jgi:hypothetical protein
MRSESGQMIASAKGHYQAERACFLEKKRSDDRNDVVRKFLKTGHLRVNEYTP